MKGSRKLTRKVMLPSTGRIMSKIFQVSTLFVTLAGVTLLSTGGCTARTQSNEPDEFVGRVSSTLGEDGGVTPKRGDLVISQVYGGGGEADAAYNHDFVELFNRSKNTLLLDGLSLQSADSTSNFTGASVVALVGSIPPGGYFLVSLDTTDAAVGAALPTADLIGALQLGATDGKVALAPSLTPLACGGANRCDKAKLLDLVGYGAVTDFEGTQSAFALDAKNAAMRKGGGCTDSDDNRADFTAEAPGPRNSATAPSQCTTTPGPAPKDAGPTPPVVDPPLGAETPYDAGAPKDAGATAGGAGSDTSSCSIAGTGVRSDSESVLVVVFGVALALSVARRKSASDER